MSNQPDASSLLHPNEPRVASLPTVLVIDDDPLVNELISHWLESSGYRVEVSADGEMALTELGRVLPDVVVLDLSLPGMGGLEVLVRIRSAMPRTPIVILTGTTDVATVVTAMQRGAYDYLLKPVDRTKLLTTVGNAFERGRLAQRVAELARTSQRDEGALGFSNIVGRSSPMRLLFRQMERVAASDVTVLVRGESGTGKELVARALHDHSVRKKGPFVAINCAAIPESLQESELFGHEKGAFTGAVARHSGRFEQAHGGTLFLDEIGEIAPSLQAKLLRVFQERRFHRVGGTQEVQVDVRIVAATHRDLVAEVHASRFREDLYYRIAVFELEVPPLRERVGDLPLLVSHLQAELEKKHGQPSRVLERATLEVLQTYDWPGNVRELQNALERAVVVASGGIVRPEDLPRRVLEARRSEALRAVQAAAAAPEPSLPELPQLERAQAAVRPRAMIDIEREAILEALDKTRHNISEACRLLGIPRTTMYRRLRRHGIPANRG